MCTQTIILEANKITCGKKGQERGQERGQEKNIFQCYMIQVVGMLKLIMRQDCCFRKPRISD